MAPLVGLNDSLSLEVGMDPLLKQSKDAGSYPPVAMDIKSSEAEHGVSELPFCEQPRAGLPTSARRAETYM